MSAQDKIEHINPNNLTPHPDNSMKHGEVQITQLVASFEQFGFNGVITIDESNVVLAGHGRRIAALRMGMETVPCLRRSSLSEQQKRAYIIADNQIGRNSEWDEEVLSRQRDQLADDGFDLESLGISPAALATIQPAPPQTASDIRAIEKNTDQSPRLAHETAADKCHALLSSEIEAVLCDLAEGAQSLKLSGRVVSK